MGRPWASDEPILIRSRELSSGLCSSQWSVRRSSAPTIIVRRSLRSIVFMATSSSTTYGLERRSGALLSEPRIYLAGGEEQQGARPLPFGDAPERIRYYLSGLRRSSEVEQKAYLYRGCG